MVLVLDNFDSFTYNIVDYLNQLNQASIVLRNDISMAEIESQEFDSILLSPGPCTPQESGVMNQLILQYHQTKPILGICLGHQALGEFFGWKLKKAIQPIHGKVSEITHTEHLLFKNISNPCTVMRYHSLILEKGSEEDIEVLASTKEGELMALKHKHLHIAGFQFHPESILTFDGLQLLRNWFDWIK